MYCVDMQSKGLHQVATLLLQRAHHAHTYAHTQHCCTPVSFLTLHAIFLFALLFVYLLVIHLKPSSASPNSRCTNSGVQVKILRLWLWRACVAWLQIAACQPAHFCCFLFYYFLLFAVIRPPSCPRCHVLSLPSLLAACWL